MSSKGPAKRACFAHELCGLGDETLRQTPAAPQAHNRDPLLRCPRVHEPALQGLGVSEDGGASGIGVAAAKTSAQTLNRTRETQKRDVAPMSANAAAPVFGTEHEVPDSDREEWVESP